MATNLISLIMDYLTPELIGRIASALGLDRNNASAAIGASVPALLAGICGAALQHNRRSAEAARLCEAANWRTRQIFQHDWWRQRRPDRQGITDAFIAVQQPSNRLRSPERSASFPD
jgi:hypothetical protein